MVKLKKVCSLHCSAQDWKFAAKQFLKKYPDDIVVHCEFCLFACGFGIYVWFVFIVMLFVNFNECYLIVESRVAGIFSIMNLRLKSCHLLWGFHSAKF